MNQLTKRKILKYECTMCIWLSKKRIDLSPVLSKKSLELLVLGGALYRM